MSVAERPERHLDDPGLAGVFLPSVVHEASAAVLIVDLRRREVTYANDLAVQLVPGLALPVPVDEWSSAAGLEDVTGLDLPEDRKGTPHGTPAESLLRVAQGEPITGEAVTAERATSVTRPREVLWVLGLPLSDAPEPIASLALVVFLPARNAQLIAGVQESAMTLRDRAVLATRMAFTITDPSQPDNPLVWVNPAFIETTGYTSEDVLGHNCRFLQGPRTDRRVIEDLRAALVDERPVTTTLLNYRKDGSAFWNELSISPIRDSAGRVTHFVGVQADVTERVEAQISRDVALSKVALVADRLALLADFSSRMATSLQPQQIVEMLADVLVPRIGTWAIVYTFEDGNRLAPAIGRHEHAAADPTVAARLRELLSLVPEQLATSSPVWRVLDGSVGHVLIEDYGSEPPAVTGSADDLRTSLMLGLGVRSVAAVPLLARSGILGCVALVCDESRPPLGSDDLALLRDLSARAGLMLENTQLYARQRAAAATLQRSLLPRLPTVPGLEIAARYVPSVDEAAVGGDWYDVFPLKDGAGVGVVVGDVMGHNYDSAARMGKLSTIVRAYAWPGIEPRVVLSAVDDLLAGSGGIDILATCLLATLRFAEGGAVLNFSSAGHPPAVLRRPDGSTTVLTGGRGAMIGVAQMMPGGAGRTDAATVELPSGSMLICFTDGLIDTYSADADIDAGLAEIARRAEALPVDVSPDQLVDQLTSGTDGAKDDIAVVAIRIV